MLALWWWIDRWRKSTAYIDLTVEEQGAYRNLLDEATLRDGVLPNDEKVLEKACGDPRIWRRVRKAVLARFVVTPDGLRNDTLDAVLRESQRRADKQAAWRARKAAEAGNEPGNTGGNGAGNTAGNNLGYQDQDQDREHKEQNPPLPARWAGTVEAPVVTPEVRAQIATVIAGVQPKCRGTAKGFHDALAQGFMALGWTVEREVRVADRGDGRAGYMDLVVVAPLLICFEFDRKTPRRKSLEKLRGARSHGFAGVVICREADVDVWWQDGDVWVWGSSEPTERAIQAATFLRRQTGCPHDPPCEVFAVCVRRMAHAGMSRKPEVA